MPGHSILQTEDDYSNMAGPSEEEPLLGTMGGYAVGASDASLVSRREGNKLPQYLGGLSACLSAFCAGTCMGWTSAASKMKDGRQGFIVSEEEWSWVSACLAIGAIISALPVGSLVNTLGRRLMVLLLVPVMIVGWALIAWASNIWMLYIGRVILGAVVGAFCIIAPMYTGEIAESSIRGTLGSFFQLLITFGILFIYGLGTLFENDPFTTNIICGVLPIVLGVVFFFFPDTPRWHMSKGRYDVAKSSLIFYRGKSYDSDGELREIEQALEEEKAQKVSFVAAFKTTAAKKGLMLSLGLMLFQQFSGINAVIFYASEIFKDAGTSMDANQSSIIVGVCQVGATLVSTMLIERLGRRILLLMSGSIMAVFNIIFGVYFYLKEVQEVQMTDYSWVPIVCVSVFIIMFSIGFGPVPWLYMGEVFPSQIKGIAMSIANMSNWGSVFIITKFYANVKTAVGSSTTFWIFAGILVLGSVFVSTILLETKGKTLEQIQTELSGNSSQSPSQSASQPSTNPKGDAEGKKF